MPTLTERLDTSLGNIDVSVSISGEAAKILAIAEIVTQLIDNPPDEFGDYLTLLSEIDLPELNVAADLDTTFGTLRELIPTDIPNLNAGLLGQLDELETITLGGVSDVIQPAIDFINALLVLFRGDISCGLISGFMDAPQPGEDGGADEPAAPPAPPAPGDPNPGPRNPAVTEEQIDTAKAVVDLLPTPLTIAQLVPWLAEFWGDHDIPYNILRAVPFIDDIRGPVATMAAWQAMDGPQMIDHFATTLSQTTAVIGQGSVDYVERVAFDLSELLAPLDSAVLAAAFDDLAAGFTAIGTAVAGDDISGIDADIARIDAALAGLQGQHLIWSGSVKVPLGHFLSSYRLFPDRLEEQMVQLISLLQPRPALRDVFNGRPPATLDDTGADLAAVDALFEEIQAFLMRVLDAIDLATVFEPLAAPFARASDVVAQIDQQLVTVTLDLQSRLASLEEAIDGVELVDLQANALQAIEEFSAQLQAQLTTRFEPVGTAFETVVNELATAVDGFDPAGLQGEIQGVIDTITGVFAAPEVQQALQQLQQLTAIGDGIDSLSFAPLTDTVIAGIDEVKSALDAIDESTLDPPLPQMLGTAMSVLPRDVRPLTDPLVADLGDLIEAGPAGLIDQVSQYPAQLFDQVRRYDPRTLLGDTLSAPYRNVMDEARGFSPGQFLGQVEREFDTLKNRIGESANPGRALQPLVALHQQLLVELARLNPATLVEPLDQKIQAVMGAVGEAIDLDALLQPLSQVIEEVNRQTDRVRKGLDLVQHVLTKLDDLADAPAQISAWIDSIFDKIPDGMDTSALAGPLHDLAGAVASTRAVQLQAHASARFAAVDTLLTELDASRRLTALVRAVAGIARSDVDALPDSAQKTGLLALLDSFDVTDQHISGALQQLATLTALQVDVSAGLSSRFDGWDDRYHRPGGTLDGFSQSAVDLGQIKSHLRAAIERQVAWPLAAVFGKVAVLKNVLARPVALLADMGDEIDAKIAALLAAPQAVLALGDSVQALVDKIAGINLDFLQESIADIFDAVREKFDAISPAPIQQALDDSFAEAIDAIDFDLVIPPDSFDDLTTAFDDVLRQLASLDPDAILVEPLQQSFAENIQPFIDSLDVTPLLAAVTARLWSLEDELRAEMERVNTAYQAMLAAAPDTDFSVDVSIGF